MSGMMTFNLDRGGMPVFTAFPVYSVLKMKSKGITKVYAISMYRSRITIVHEKKTKNYHFVMNFVC